MVKRSFRHWTARYMIDRLRVMLYERMHPDTPWLCRDALRIMDSWLKPTDKGIEWGSGRSTIWLAMKVAHLISVEHDPMWAEIVRKKLHDRCLISHVTYHLLPDGKEENGTCDYVNVVNEIAPNAIDFCLVDGVCRDYCALACLEKLRPGGILIVDNIERYFPRPDSQTARSPNSRGPQDGFASEQWEDFGKIVKDWRSIWTTNGVWDTALWIKAPQRF